MTIQYSSDALDRRMEIRVMNGATTTITRFVYDGSDVVLDLDGQDNNNVLAEYLHGPGTDEILKVTRGNDTGYYIQDHMGSVVRIIDAGGTVLNSYRYLAWGEVFAADTVIIENRYGYTGRELNPDGRTMHYRAREYMPHLGRFLQEDPAGFVDGVNLYRYVRNGPCAFVDPSGQCSICVALFRRWLFGDGSKMTLEMDFVVELGEIGTPVGDLEPVSDHAGEPLNSQLYSFYDTEYANAFGKATLFTCSGGDIVGFYDRYEMNPMDWGERSLGAEVLTRLGAFIGRLFGGGADYDIVGGRYAK